MKKKNKKAKRITKRTQLRVRTSVKSGLNPDIVCPLFCIEDNCGRYENNPEYLQMCHDACYSKPYRYC